MADLRNWRLSVPNLKINQEIDEQLDNTDTPGPKSWWKMGDKGMKRLSLQPMRSIELQPDAPPPSTPGSETSENSEEDSQVN